MSNNTETKTNPLLPLLGKARHTRFFTVKLPATAVGFGIPLGDGKCQGVSLKTNNFVLNTTTGTGVAGNLRVFYYGDANSQLYEYDASGNPTDIIYCKDLSEVYIRCLTADTHIQVMVYLSDEDLAEWENKRSFGN